MQGKSVNVLVLCTGNSARSILGEVLINSLGAGRFHAFSAGSQPTGTVNPAALRQLEACGHETAGLRSKSWDEFSNEHDVPVDLVITVCDNAAGESCPAWLGGPLTVHWGIPDPAAAEGDAADVQETFEQAYRVLRTRIELLVELPFGDLTDSEICSALESIASYN